MSTPLYRSRPTAFDIAPASSEAALDLGDGIWCSPGLSNSYLLVTETSRIVVNTGMGFEAPVHRAAYDAVSTKPISHVLLTQGHFDHVGGVDLLRDPGTEVVAHASFAVWRDDNERLEQFRSRNAAFAWIDAISKAVAHAQDRGGDLPAQSRPEPTITFEETLTLDVGGRTLELIATPGGETTDSIVVWLPEERVCICGNVFGALFGHIPNLVTMRGDRYRDALAFVDAVETVRALGARRLLTGHFGPIDGESLVRDELTRLGAAVMHVHDATVRGMEEGADVWTLMREIRLPPELEVGQGYGTVPWDVRAIWENYAGWFHHRSTTELYAVRPDAHAGDVVDLAGSDALVERARAHVARGAALDAIQLTDLVLAVEPSHDAARRVAADAHELLLAASENFWETSWLRRQVDRLRR